MVRREFYKRRMYVWYWVAITRNTAVKPSTFNARFEKTVFVTKNVWSRRRYRFQRDIHIEIGDILLRILKQQLNCSTREQRVVWHDYNGRGEYCWNVVCSYGVRKTYEPAVRIDENIVGLFFEESTERDGNNARNKVPTSYGFVAGT